MPAGKNAEVLIVLPVYNEARSLVALLSRFEALQADGFPIARIVAVNDGSTDASATILEAFGRTLPVEILTHGSNAGLGATIQNGLARAAALARPADAIVTMDADDTHPPELIPSMLHRLDDGLDVVIASRYRPGSRVEGLAISRRAATHGARWLLQTVAPIAGVRDYTCGFRAYRAAALQTALERNNGRLSEEPGFASMAEILLSLAASGARCGEVPFVLNYRLKGGASKMNVPRTALRVFRLALRWKFPSRAASQQRQPYQPRRPA